MKLIEKIKYFLILTGIFALIAFFYITKKKLEIKSLQKLIQKAYKQKQKILDNKIKETLSKTSDSKVSAEKYIEQLDKLDSQKMQIEINLKNLSNEELTESINKWFKEKP